MDPLFLHHDLGNFGDCVYLVECLLGGYCFDHRGGLGNYQRFTGKQIYMLLFPQKGIHFFLLQVKFFGVQKFFT